MRKLCKFLLGTLSLAALACGAYYFFKNYMCKESNEDFEDLDDAFDEYEAEETVKPADTREYVSINITSEQDTEPKVDDEINETEVSEDTNAEEIE